MENSTQSNSNKDYVSLNSLIEKTSISGVNVKPGFQVHNILNPNNNIPLESDVDEQIIFNITFSQPIRLHSIKIESAESNAPRDIRLYSNIITLGFEDVDDTPATQKLTIHEDFYNSAEAVPLQFVKFQNVKTLSIFIENNLEESDITSLQRLTFLGQSIHQTNMSLLGKDEE